MTLNQKLKNYQQTDPYESQNREFFKQLLVDHPVTDVISETISILKQGENDSYTILLFLRNAVLFRTYDPEFKPIATEKYPDQLERLLFELRWLEKIK